MTNDTRGAAVRFEYLHIYYSDHEWFADGPAGPDPKNWPHSIARTLDQLDRHGWEPVTVDLQGLAALLRRPR